jgi:hypothetical protein
MANKKITALDLAPFVGLQCAIYKGSKPSHLFSKQIDGVNIKLNKVIVDGKKHNPEDIKPILQELSELTVEDTVHINCNIIGYDKSSKKQYQKWHETDLNDIKEYGFLQFDTSQSIFLPEIIKYLISRGFNMELIPHGTYLIGSNGIVESSLVPISY